MELCIRAARQSLVPEFLQTSIVDRDAHRFHPGSEITEVFPVVAKRCMLWFPASYSAAEATVLIRKVPRRRLAAWLPSQYTQLHRRCLPSRTSFFFYRHRNSLTCGKQFKHNFLGDACPWTSAAFYLGGRYFNSIPLSQISIWYIGDSRSHTTSTCVSRGKEGGVHFARNLNAFCHCLLTCVIDLNTVAILASCWLIRGVIYENRTLKSHPLPGVEVHTLGDYSVIGTMPQ